MFSENDIPLLEIDDEKIAIINPEMTVSNNTPKLSEHCVITFFGNIVRSMLQNGEIRIVDSLHSDAFQMNIYEYIYSGEKINLFLPAVGAPNAAGTIEELHVRGCKKFVACGGAGVLHSNLHVGHLIVPTSGIRDEGTSYQYIPAEREVCPSEKALKAICDTLDEKDIVYEKGKTWTTDAFYRETRARYERRKAQGCLTVEMEFTAFCAVAEFRGVEFGQVLYGGDDLSGEEWNHRGWNSRDGIRRDLIDLACEACFRM